MLGLKIVHVNDVEATPTKLNIENICEYIGKLYGSFKLVAYEILNLDSNIVVNMNTFKDWVAHSN